MKQCLRCGEVKDDDSFNKGKSYCRECWSEMARAYYKKHAEERRTYSRAYYADNRETCLERQQRYKLNHKDELDQAKLTYYQEHIEERREYSRTYRDAHREKVNKKSRQYCQDHPEQYRGYTNKRRALKMQLPNDLTLEQWENAVGWFDGKCAYCDTKIDGLEQEHFIPITQGGGTTLSNIVPACSKCNGSKHNAMPELFAPYALARIQTYFAEVTGKHLD